MREVRGGRLRPLEKQFCGKDTCGKKMLNMTFESMRRRPDSTIAMQHPKEQHPKQWSSLPSVSPMVQIATSDNNKTITARIIIILPAFIFRQF
jgi:hypothetical protein